MDRKRLPSFVSSRLSMTIYGHEVVIDIVKKLHGKMTDVYVDGEKQWQLVFNVEDFKSEDVAVNWIATILRRFLNKPARTREQEDYYGIKC